MLNAQSRFGDARRRHAPCRSLDRSRRWRGGRQVRGRRVREGAVRRAGARGRALHTWQGGRERRTDRARQERRGHRGRDAQPLLDRRVRGGQRPGDDPGHIDAPEGWDAAGLGAFPADGGATVGIVDTGIDATHEDLAGKVSACASVNASDEVVEGECADGHGHGTHVAGTAAGKANNGVGVAGVAFNAKLAICRGLDASGSGTFAGVANCVTWLASKGVDVISMSAAGNGGNSTPSYPAAYPEVISVAATDNVDARAWFSTFNADVEVAAAGVDILSAKLGGGYVTMSGTSMATPHVAGVAALIAGSSADLTPADIRARLDAAVDDKGAAGRDPEFGFGRVTLSKAFG